jgi:predicted enzyme related to lactoylglutathione lyase
VVKKLEGVIISSSNAKKLAGFYQDTVGLKQVQEYVMGDHDEAVFVFDLAGISLAIVDHSDVKGKNANPERVMLNFEVDNIDQEVARLKQAKVKLVQDTYHVQDYGHIATFADPEGNYFQLVKTQG